MQNLRRLSPRSFLPLAAVAGLGLALSGCGGSPTSTREIAAASVGTGAGFRPSEVTVNKDDNVVLSVGNTTGAVHGFSIEGYGIQEQIEPSSQTELRFKSTKPGTFKIYCQLHEGHQIATLVVQ